jgi:hypothetical protein
VSDARRRVFHLKSKNDLGVLMRIVSVFSVLDARVELLEARLNLHGDVTIEVSGIDERQAELAAARLVNIVGVEQVGCGWTQVEDCAIPQVRASDASKSTWEDVG